MVPYEFFSQFFCVSVEELIDIALLGPKYIVLTVAFYSVWAKPSCGCVLNLPAPGGAQCVERPLDQCAGEVYVGTGWLHNQLLVLLSKFRPVPKPVSDAAVHTAQLTSVSVVAKVIEVLAYKICWVCFNGVVL